MGKHTTCYFIYILYNIGRLRLFFETKKRRLERLCDYIFHRYQHINENVVTINIITNYQQHKY